jgi:hypothetical protein
VTPLERALGRAREVIDALPAGSEVALVLAGTPPRVLCPRTDELALARAKLDEMRPAGARGTALGPAVELAARQLAGARHPVRRVVLLGDFAAHAGAEALEKPPGVELWVERAGGARAAPNLAIVDAVAAPDPSTPGTISIAVEVRAWNDGRDRAALSVRRAGAEIARGEVVLAEGGGRAHLRISAPEGPDPTCEVALVLDPPDALPLDDVRGLLLRPVSAPRVLIVDGHPQPLGRRPQGLAGEGAHFLTHALSVEPGERGGFVHRTVDPDAFLTTTLADVDVIVFADVPLAEPAMRARLEEHVGRGGGLLVWGGDQVRPGDAVRLGSLLPARIVAVAEGDVTGVVRGNDVGLFPPGPTGLERVRAHRRLVLEAVDGAQVALAWSDGLPALVLGPEPSEGRGRVAVVGVSADDRWSDLPLRPGFLPLVLELVRALVPPGSMPDAPFEPGSAPELRAPFGASVLALVAPSGRVFEHRGRELLRPIDLSDVVEPGAWRVRVGSFDGAFEEAPRAAFVVAAPASESDLTPGPEPAVSAGGRQREQAARPTVRRSWAPWLDALVGVIALVEGALRIARRKTG